jgi:hypothetical protein
MQGAAAQEEILGFLKDLGKNVSKRKAAGVGRQTIGVAHSKQAYTLMTTCSAEHWM